MWRFIVVDFFYFEEQLYLVNQKGFDEQNLLKVKCYIKAADDIYKLLKQYFENSVKWWIRDNHHLYKLHTWHIKYVRIKLYDELSHA